MADKSIKITVANKKASLIGTPVIVCGNSDYSITFTFDSEWSLTGVKTARFVYTVKGVKKYTDVPFSGNTVKVPVLADTVCVNVGVYEGNLATTTPARIVCTPSILCGTGTAQGLTEDVYNQLLEAINELAEKGAFGATEEQAQQINSNTQNIDVLTDRIDKLENYVTPEMFGAKGDGVTDDTLAFQNAITSGCTVVIEGTYIISKLDINVGNIMICSAKSKSVIEVTDSINISANFVTLKDLYIHSKTNNTLLNVTGKYNSFDNCRFYGKNNGTGNGVNVSNYCNNFINCAIRQFANNVTISNNYVNFTNCYLIASDNVTIETANIIIEQGNVINFTDCDIEKGNKVIEINGGLSTFSNSYIEGGTNPFKIVLNDGKTTFNNNYLNHMYVLKRESNNLTVINNIIELSIESTYFLTIGDINAGRITAYNNTLKDNIGNFVGATSKRASTTHPRLRYRQDGTGDLANCNENRNIFIMQDNCKIIGNTGKHFLQILPNEYINMGDGYTKEAVAGIQYFDRYQGKLITCTNGTENTWLDSLGNTPSGKKEKPPTDGEWKVGDIVFNSNPLSNNYIGWVYTSDNTWKGFGLIQ